MAPLVCATARFGFNLLKPKATGAYSSCLLTCVAESDPLQVSESPIVMNSKQLISSEIERFYNQASEETRLDKGMGVFEFERIKTLIDKYLTASPATILDIGGGTGKYAAWLAQKGHHVHMVEPLAKHLALAQQRAQGLKHKFAVHQGAAGQLPFANRIADLVILHGPLYHLQTREERVIAIQEARRVLKKGGVILGFAINYTASTLVGLLQGLIHKQAFFQMCTEELTTGLHNQPDEFPWLLAEAFYHRPGQLKEEFDQEGLRYLNTYAVEGITWLDKNYFASMRHPTKSKKLSELLHLTENDEALHAFSPHMMIAVQKLTHHVY